MTYAAYKTVTKQSNLTITVTIALHEVPSGTFLYGLDLST